MFCSKCGKDMRDDTVLCPSCGFSSNNSTNAALKIHSKIKLFLLISLILNLAKSAVAIIIFALTFIIDLSAMLSQFSMPYESAHEIAGTIFMCARVICGIIAVTTLAIGFVNFYAGISGSVLMRNNYKFYVKDHISSAIVCGVGAFIMGIVTAYIRGETGVENAMSIFPIFLFLLIIALVHIFMAILPEELSKLDNAEVSKSKIGGKIILMGSAVAITAVAVIFVAIYFIFGGTGLSGKYGHYMESENRYGYTIEFNSDGSCLLEQIYDSEIISGTLDKNDSGNYSINWDRYYGTWIVRKQDDILVVSGTGVGKEGTVFERIE